MPRWYEDFQADRSCPHTSVVGTDGRVWSMSGQCVLGVRFGKGRPAQHEGPHLMRFPTEARVVATLPRPPYQPETERLAAAMGALAAEWEALAARQNDWNDDRRDRADAMGHAAEQLRDRLAAVVSSSPATPPVDGYCVCDGGPPARDCGIPAHRAAAEAALDRYRAGPSPATPEGPEKRACVRCLHGWYGHDRGSGPCLHEDCSCEGFTLRATSPATPEGGRADSREVLRQWQEAAWDEGWEAAKRGEQRRNPHRLSAPDLVDGLNATQPPAPSPASPAETREGRALAEHYRDKMAAGPQLTEVDEDAVHHLLYGDWNGIEEAGWNLPHRALVDGLPISDEQRAAVHEALNDNYQHGHEDALEVQNALEGRASPLLGRRAHE